MTAYLIQCIGEDHYNVAVIPTNAKSVVLEIVRSYIDTKWCIEVEDVELFMSDNGEVVNVEVEGHGDEDYFVISEVEVFGFEVVV